MSTAKHVLEHTGSVLLSWDELFGTSYEVAEPVEYIVNGGFNDDSVWAVDGWTISGGVATSSAPTYMSQTFEALPAGTYTLSFTVTDMPDASLIRANLDGGLVLAAGDVGNYSTNVVAAGGETELSFLVLGGSNIASIDDVSLVSVVQ